MVEPLILAGTSEYGVCHHCGAPYERILDREHVGDWNNDPAGKHSYGTPNSNKAKDAFTKYKERQANHQPEDRFQSKASRNGSQFSQTRALKNTYAAREAGGAHDNPFPAPETLGWQPTCSHPLFPSEIVRPMVMDIFSGSARTGLKAVELGRDYLGIELNPDYVLISRWKYQQWLKKQAASVPADPDTEGDVVPAADAPELVTEEP
jgi:hypothetical protein